MCIYKAQFKESRSACTPYCEFPCVNVLHRVPKKPVHQADIDNFINFNGFSKFFHWHTRWKIGDKIIIKDPTTPNMRRYTTLWNKHFQKLHQPKHIND